MAGKKISQLSSSLAPNLGAVLPIVYSGVTYKATLQSLRNVLVDSGSHIFTGSQQINGNLLVSGSVTASYFVGDGSQLTNLPNGGGNGVPNGTISGSLQLDELGYITSSSLDGLVSGSGQIQYSDITGIPNPTDVSMFLSSSTFNDFTSAYNNESASFDQRIINATNEQDLSNFATIGSNVFMGDQVIYGSLSIKGVTEEIVYNESGNDQTFDYESGTIYYITGLTSNGMWNVSNIPTESNKAVTITFVVTQGSTPYSGSIYQINDETVTVKWADSTIPTGSANKTNVIGLTAFRVGSSWNVLGSLSIFG